MSEPLEHAVDLTILVPCKNEENHIRGTLDTVVASMRKVGCRYEVLVFDDGSVDGTSAVVEEYRRENPDLPILLHRNPRNLGLSRTFVDGAFAGRGRYFRLVCGDNVEPMETIVAVVSRMGVADMVIPYHSKSAGSPLRIGISRLYTFLVNLCTGYRLRYYNGNPLFRRDHVMRWHPYSFGFGFQADLIARLLDEDATYIEVPVHAIRRDKRGPASFLNPRNFVSTAHTLYELLRRRLNRLVFESDRATNRRRESRSQDQSGGV
jgi:glycosyltransferase involved in cell wall biosynthesis